MTEGVGLSVGATNLTSIVVDRAAVTRSPVLTLYPHRPSEVGVPSENPNLTERGLIITDFVDRVGDPVGIVASDGSTHRADGLLADALRAMLFAVGRGRPPADPVAVTYPAHWRSTAVAALRNALAAVPQFQGSKPASVVSDATAALTALQRDPGVPSRGVIAVCDFGGTGTSITLVDAANGFQPIGETVRHTDFSGDLIDQALLTHVINDLSAAGTIDLSGTSAIGSLTRLRGQCRGAKERLSTAAVTSLAAELPGRRTDVRLTRNELDDAIRQPLADFVGVVQETVDRSGIRGADLVAVASVGGGARTPIITTTLSEHFRVPVITTANPELTAAIGGGLAAARGTVEEGMTSMAAAPAAAAAAAMGAEDEPTVTGSSTVQALAWSEADDIPDLAPTDPYDYTAEADTGGVTDARPPMQFDREPYEEEAAAPLPWYRRPAVVAGVGLLALLAALTAAVLFVLRNDSAPTPASTTTPVTTTPTPTPTPSTTVAAPPPPPPPPVTQAPPPRTRTVTREAPPPVIQTQAPPPPPTYTEAPPPPPPTHTEAPPPTEPPPPTDPPPTTQPPLIPTIPPITLFPGGPTIPIGPQPPAP
jgi:actin-like ATPase involved in cell morphogenesis